MLHHYKEEGFDFLLKAFNSPNYLEDLTGLSQLYAQTFDDQVSISLLGLHLEKFPGGVGRGRCKTSIFKKAIFPMCIKHTIYRGNCMRNAPPANFRVPEITFSDTNLSGRLYY